jgi:WD40 repeat protein
MPEEAGGGRRILVATGVTTGLPKSGGRLAESVERISGLFQGKLGYERMSALGLDPAREPMRQQLRALAKRCRPGDYIALYHTGHADVVAGKHRLWMGDTEDPVTDTIVTAELAELMLADTPVSNLLVILDTCFAGQGGADLLMAGLKAAGSFSGKTLLAITSAHPKQQVRAGDFARLFERSVDHPATAGYEPRYLSPVVIVSNINKDTERKAWQTVSYNTLLGTDEAPFLLNPRYETALHGLDLATQAQLVQDEQRRQDLERFFSPRARGVDVPEEPGWNFVGRHAALREIVTWLETPGDSRARVITGAPGSGKSAVIGRLTILSHPDWGKTVPRQGILPDTIPPARSIDVAIHARNRTADEVLQALSAAAHVTAATPGELLRALGGRPMVAAIDAIDEAVDPDRLITTVLNPLIEAGPKAGLRLLLGTRSYLLDRLSDRADCVDLDDERYADPESLRLYAERVLLTTTKSLYASADRTLVSDVAGAVARAAGRSFLVALITSRTLASVRKLADPDDPLWLARLPGTAAEAMEQDLETRLGDQAARARDLLRPLAYASGNGLPWEDIWAPLASSIASRQYGDEDLIWLRRNAGSYVVEALEPGRSPGSGRSVYRLYHAALAEYLRRGQDEKRVHQEFVTLLLSRVQRSSDQERAWPDAHPYVLSHLATHAAAAGEFASLASDPSYLACAASPGLLAAFNSAVDPQTRSAGVAYERSMHRLRGSDLAEKLSYLEFAARRARAGALADRIARYPIRRAWAVRWLQAPPDHPHRVLVGHRGPVREVVAISREDSGLQAVSVGDDGTVRLWDLAAGEQIGMRQESSVPLSAVDVVELPGRGPMLAVLSSDGMLTTHELPSLSRVLRVPVYAGLRDVFSSAQLITAEMRCLRLPDGRWAAVTGGPGMMTAAWDIRDGTLVIRFPSGISPATVEFGTDGPGGLTATGIDARAGDQHVSRSPTRQSSKRPGTESSANTFDGLPDMNSAKHAKPSAGFPYRVTLGGRVVTLTPVRGMARARNTVVLSGHGGEVTDADVVAGPGGTAALVSSSTDGTVRLWDLAAADARASSDGMSGDPSTILADVSAQPTRTLGLVIAADPDKNVTVVDLDSGEQVGQLESPSELTMGGTCAWIPGLGHIAVTFGAGGMAWIWLLPVGGLVSGFATHFGSIRRQADRLTIQTAYVPLADRPLVITCGHGGKAVVWDLVDRRIHDVLGGHTGPVSTVACGAARNGDPIAATGGQDNRVCIWDLLRRRQIGAFKLAGRLAIFRNQATGRARTVSLSLTKDHRLVVLVLCEDGQLKLFRQRRGWPRYDRAAVDAGGAAALAVLRLADGRLIALTGGPDGRLCGWDIGAVLDTNGKHGKNTAPMLLSIETEVSITGLSVTGDDSVVASTLTGLAAFRLDTERLGHGN